MIALKPLISSPSLTKFWQKHKHAFGQLLSIAAMLGVLAGLMRVAGLVLLTAWTTEVSAFAALLLLIGSAVRHVPLGQSIYWLFFEIAILATFVFCAMGSSLLMTG